MRPLYSSASMNSIVRLRDQDSSMTEAGVEGGSYMRAIVAASAKYEKFFDEVTGKTRKDWRKRNQNEPMRGGGVQTKKFPMHPENTSLVSRTVSSIVCNRMSSARALNLK